MVVTVIFKFRLEIAAPEAEMREAIAGVLSRVELQYLCDEMPRPNEFHPIEDDNGAVVGYFVCEVRS